MRAKTTKIGHRLDFWGREIKSTAIKMRLAHLSYLSSFEAGRGGHDAPGGVPLWGTETRPAFTGDFR